MQRACAILATFNEADIIVESVRKLIAGGVEVFVIDNGSTDHTLELLNPLVGRGVVDIRTVKFHEDGREVYDWTSILRLKEELSKELGFDWYLHVDADEIRYAPWPNLSLREGLDRVDHSGYNLVNFKLFNFRLTEDIAASDDYERDMPAYSAGEYFNQYQVKAWKAHPNIDIVANGGHIARRPDGKIYPVRFIHKHYPVRSLEHGQRKILQERKQRFSTAEKQRGWHVQYDQMADVKAEDVFWQSDRLAPFDLHAECSDLLQEGLDVATRLLAVADLPALEGAVPAHLLQRYAPDTFPAEHVLNLSAVTRQLMAMLAKGELPNIAANPRDIEFMHYLGRLIASGDCLRGDTSSYSRLDQVKFQ